MSGLRYRADHPGHAQRRKHHGHMCKEFALRWLPRCPVSATEPIILAMHKEENMATPNKRKLLRKVRCTGYPDVGSPLQSRPSWPWATKKTIEEIQGHRAFPIPKALRALKSSSTLYDGACSASTLHTWSSPTSMRATSPHPVLNTSRKLQCSIAWGPPPALNAGRLRTM